MLALAPVQQVPCGSGLRALEVVARHALVEDGGDLAPRREHLLALGHRPPHGARAGEVLARRRVVDRRRPGSGAIWHSIARSGSAMSKCVPVRSASVRSARSCIQSRNASASVELPCRVGVEGGHGVGHRGTGAGDLRRRSRHLGLDAVQLLPAPRVGLVEVDHGAEEVAGVAGVVLAAHGLLVARRGASSSSRKVAGVGERRAGRLGVCASGRSASLSGTSVALLRGAPRRSRLRSPIARSSVRHLVGRQDRSGGGG